MEEEEMKVLVGVLALAIAGMGCKTTTGPSSCSGLTIHPDSVHMRIGDVQLFHATGGDVGAQYMFAVADPSVGRLSVDVAAGTASFTALKEPIEINHTVVTVQALCGGQEKSTFATVVITPR